MLRIGHRGAAGHETENTLSSIRTAINLNCDYIEVDVQKTRDGKLVLFHDKLLDRVSNATGYIWEYSYAHLSAEVTLHGSHKIPLLAEACEEVRGTGIGLITEVITFGAAYEVLELLLALLPAGSFALASFEHSILSDLRSMRSDIRTIALLEGSPIGLKSAIELTGCNAVGFCFDAISEVSIADVHQLGLQVYAWTVNHPKEIARAGTLGIDGVISDFPDRVPKP